MNSQLVSVIEAIVAVLALAAAVGTLAVGLKSGIVRLLRFGPLEIQTMPLKKDGRAEKMRSSRIVAPALQPTAAPFEIEEASHYYAQILAQSRVSFWFSLIFAALGFVVIIVAGFAGLVRTNFATIAQFASGGIIEAVSSLFFVQSRQAQASMGQFFEKAPR